MRRLLAIVALTSLGLLFSSAPAEAFPGPGPICAGDGSDVNVLGTDGGYCDMLFMPDPKNPGNEIHVHCEWGGAGISEFMPISNATNCWRVNSDGSMVPPPVPPQRDQAPVLPPLPGLPPPPG